MGKFIEGVIDFLLPNRAQRWKAFQNEMQLLQSKQANDDQTLSARFDEASRALREIESRFNEFKLLHERKADLPPNLLLKIDHLPKISLADRRTEEQKYAEFENRYYDSATVACNQRKYVPFLPTTGRKLAIDLGSGRGEFMQILTECGWSPIGFDSNSVQCDVAKAKGLSVSCVDLMDGLNGLDRESVDLVSALQIVEHMTPTAIKSALERSSEVLVSNGKIIVETVNPLSPYALSHFWLDETHIRPVCAYWLEFCLSHVGFTEIQTLYQDPVPAEWRTNSVLSNYSNYAVIATKP